MTPLQKLQKIDELVNTDFGLDMDCKLMPRSQPYTQHEAVSMAKFLGKIYAISHTIHCKTCVS